MNRRGIFLHTAKAHYSEPTVLIQPSPHPAHGTVSGWLQGAASSVPCSRGRRPLPSVASSRPTTCGLAAMACPTPGWMAKLASRRVSLTSTSCTWAGGLWAPGCSGASPTRFWECRSSLQNVRNSDSRVGMLPFSWENCSRAWLFFAVRLPRIKTIRTTKSCDKSKTKSYKGTGAGTSCWKSKYSI